jgi:hypothetical protein
MKPHHTNPSAAPTIASLVTILLSMAAVTANAATIADIAGDYTGPSTMPAGWGYLSSNQATGGTEGLLSPNLAIGNGGNFGFGKSDGSWHLPGVVGSKDPASLQYEIFGDGDANSPVLGTDLLLHPGSDAANNTVIVRYTISLAQINAFGTMGSIAGSFREMVNGGDSVIVSIYQNATQLFTQTGTGATLTEANGTFNITGLTMAADDTISFVVNANTNAAADETALRGTIALIPEPSTYALFAGSLCFILVGRRSRKA